MTLNLLISEVSSTMFSLLAMWKFALAGIIMGIVLVCIAVGKKYLNNLRKRILIRLFVGVEQLIGLTLYGKNTPEPQILMFNEILSVMNKFRAVIRRDFGIDKTQEKKAIKEIDIKKEHGAGVIIWCGTRVESFVFDDPENTIRTISDKLKSTIADFISVCPDKEEAKKVIEKGLGVRAMSASDLVDAIEGRDCKNPDCPVHNGIFKPKTHSDKIGVA